MKSPLSTAIIYIVFGIIFVSFAIHQVTNSGWGIFAYLLILLATIDLGSGIRILFWHYKMKNREKK
ncbi:DUF4305 domain-containing protein [Bacillus kwashiorkori]|uniref:DUF4305 domain-containing protein n=1 Tax=Bacillus kwashiorkori TaxID=1522318 RepID=UPI000781A39E